MPQPTYTIDLEPYLKALETEIGKILNEDEAKPQLPFLTAFDDWMYIIQTLYFIADTQENERCRKLANLLSKLSRSEE
jgi:hypothetical protein